MRIRSKHERRISYFESQSVAITYVWLFCGGAQEVMQHTKSLKSACMVNLSP